MVVAATAEVAQESAVVTVAEQQPDLAAKPPASPLKRAG